MPRKTAFEDLLKLTAALCASGLLFASSCSVQGVRAVGAGFNAAAGYFDDQPADDDDDISFGDWLADELKD